jgi:hypothetical protein
MYLCLLILRKLMTQENSRELTAPGYCDIGFLTVNGGRRHVGLILSQAAVPAAAKRAALLS